MLEPAGVGDGDERADTIEVHGRARILGQPPVVQHAEAVV
jgi:hypothetical protein